MTNIHEISLVDSDKKFECDELSSILKGGLRHGLALKYQCSNGTCGICKAVLISGDIKQIRHHDYALSTEELINNTFLMCCQAPLSNVELRLNLINDVGHIAIQKIQTKIKNIRFINGNMAIINLRTPRSKTLQFMAGQDVELSFKGVVSRYPIASCPCHSMELEFHIKHLKGDDFSQIVFSKNLKSKEKINLTGPKGVFILKENSIKPMVFIAWDSGFAPIRSLIEHAISLEMSNSIYFYWGYPAADKKPYFDNHAQSWFAAIDKYYYQPIACNFDRTSNNDCRKIADKIYNSLNHLEFTS